MAEEKQSAEADDMPDGIPMSKASPIGKIAGGLIGAVVLVLIIMAVSGGEDAEESKAKVDASEEAANAKAGMTKEELKERQEHLKRTQAAFIAAAADDAEESKEKKQAAAAKPTAASTKPSGSNAGKAATAKPKPKPSPKATKKDMDSLDSLGADIAGALK